MSSWDTEWAGGLAARAMSYLNRWYVPGADFSALEPAHDEVVAAGVAEDPERYRRAIRAYVRAGLREFRRREAELAAERAA